MKHRHNSPACAAALAGLALTLTPLSAQVVFSERFEAPVVSGFASNTLPSGGNWIGSTGAFNSTLRGLYNESVIAPVTPAFSTPFGKQGYSLNYSTTLLTTSQGATGQTITADVTYTLTFHAAMAEGTTADYLAHLVAFDVADDNAARQNSNSMAGTIVAQTSGAITASDMSDYVTLVFTPDATHPHLGKELGIRFDKASGNAIYDNVRLILGHDYAPSPASGEDLSVGGNVTLDWSNLPAESPATEAYVDILFGTDPGNLGLILDGQLASSVVASAPAAGTYYWQILSYPDGNPEGTPVPSGIFSFTIADTDGDGIPDDWEILYFGSGTGADANADPDEDGLTNLQEYNLGTHPTNSDTDGDGLLDGVETATGIWVSASDTGTLPLVADTDGDGLLDGAESNTGVWVNASNTGTSPITPDTDGDGLLDSWETNTGTFVSRTNSGTNPHDKDTDNDGVWDYYEVAAAFTDPNDGNETPNMPYPLPVPDPSDTGVTNKPVKVYIMSGQSNMLGFGKVSGPEDFTLDNITGKFNRFPNLVGPGGEYLARPDVKYRGVYSGIANMPLAPGGGKDSNSIGPELGFGHVMGWYHDEPVLLLKSSIGNRSLGWDVLPPGSPSYEFTKMVNGQEVTLNYAGYGERSQTYPVGESSAPWTPGDWYAGKEFDGYFTDESDWANPDEAVINVVDVLDDFATQYPEWAGQDFEIAGFVWWQGDKDRYDMGYASKYEQNLVNLINTLRNYYSNRYPGKVVPNAAFVLATLGQTTMDDDNAAEKAILDAKFAVDGDSGKYPEFAGNVKTVYANPLSQGGESSGHYGLNSETYLLVGDALGVAMLEMQDDTSPPSPNPLTFAIEPTAVDATTVGMVATTGIDNSGPVEYLFENVTTAETSGWITGTRWDNTGLAAGGYDYRVKARDALGNEGDWSATVSASPGADIIAPSPAPAFSGPLTVLGEVSIAMTASAASDINGVEYSFACTGGGGPDSGWQASPEFTALGLNPGTEYTYVVRARDGVGNVTADSAPASATTDAPDTTAPTPDPMSFATAPAATGTTSITMSATIATDESGVEYFFEAVTGGGNNSGWQDSATYTDTGLNPGTEYGYRVRARDKSPAATETEWSDALTATTETPDTTAPTPDPMTFASPPAATGSDTIAMTATTASDPSGIEYLFANVTLGTDSGWQASPVFTSTGLQPETEYVYQVKARDLSDNLNETAFSAPAAATTTAVPSGPGGAVIYEPFDDADATLAGNTPGFGLTGTWSAGGGTTVVAGSLGFGDLTTTGNRVSVSSGSNATVTFGSTLAEAGLLANGATLWFSFIVQTDASSSTNDQAAFVLGTGALGTGNNIPMSSGNSGVGIAYFRGSRLNAASWNNAISQTGPNSGLATNTPTLLVAKIEWGADDQAAETITIYKPDAALALPATAHAVHTAPALNQAGFSSIAFTRKGDVGKVDFYDEIRFGATYEDVVGLGGNDPEPGPVVSFDISPIASPQTVGTPITGITLTARDAEGEIATSFTGTVIFGGTGGFTGTSATFTAGVLENVSVTPTASGSNLTFTVDDEAGSTGSTLIATIDPAANAFATWSGGLAFGGDANGDGIDNGMAWVLGASDPAADATTLLPTFDNTSDPEFFIFTYRRLDNAASAPNTTIAVEYGSDLSGWTAATAGADIQINVTDDGAATGVDLVEVRIRRTLAVSNKLFARLTAVVSQP